LERVLASGATPGEWQTVPVADLSGSTRAYLVERGLITPSFAAGDGPERAFALYRSGEASIEVNGQDHFVMLACTPGENLSALWGTLSSVDDTIENEFNYAFDERYGFLSARPEMAGTGVRAFLTLHVPALMVTGRLGAVALQLLGQGLTLTPLWGGAGGLFQVSNNGGLGIAELPVIEAVRAASGQIIDKERSLRKKLLRDDRPRVLDYIGRALGMAQQAWLVGVDEGLGLISAIHSGVDMGLVEAPGVTSRDAFKLMQRIQPGHLAIEQGSAVPGGTHDDERLDQVRARLLRSTYAQARVLDRRR
jgi:protein arginine kinase